MLSHLMIIFSGYVDEDQISDPSPSSSNSSSFQPISGTSTTPTRNLHQSTSPSDQLNNAMYVYYNSQPSPRLIGQPRVQPDQKNDQAEEEDEDETPFPKDFGSEDTEQVQHFANPNTGPGHNQSLVSEESLTLNAAPVPDSLPHSYRPTIGH